MLLQRTTNDAQNGSPVEGSFPATWQANPACNLWGFLNTSNKSLKELRLKKKGNNLLYSQNLQPYSGDHSLQKEQDATFLLRSSQCHCTQQHLSDPRHLWNVSWPFTAPLQKSVLRKEKKPKQMNKIRSKQTTREENKPINPPEWLPWIIASQAGLNLLDILVFESKEAFGTYLKLKWWAVKALAGTGISSAYVSALFLLLAPAPCLPMSRDRLGRVAGGSNSFYCDTLPATAASRERHLLIHGHFYLYSSFIKAMGRAIGW